MVETLVAAAVSTAISAGVSLISGALAGTQKLADVTGARLSDLKVQTSTYGSLIRMVFSTTRIAGNVIWSQDIKETETRTTQSSGGKGGGGGKTQQTTVNYVYSVSMAISLCEGPIDAVLRIWADSVPLDLTKGTYRIYYGNETQNPDPFIESLEGVGKTPAYRGLAYVVVEDFPLADYGNRIPNFTFEVRRNTRNSTTVEDKIKEIVLIPGSGEFVYDTVIQKKNSGYQDANGDLQTNGLSNAVNSHNFDGGANIITALKDLKRDLPNVETIAIVVNWFASTIEANTCTIVPKIEYNGDNNSTTPDSWSVAGLSRSTAQVINYFPDNVPSYGGTPSDVSLVRMCKYIKNILGLNIMLYPMPLVDIVDPLNPKPWRGRITTAASSGANTRISNFFNGANKYNAFIRHYVNLTTVDGDLMSFVDSVVIGTEMVGLTQVHWPAASGIFPAVSEFITLAGLVKSDLAAQGYSSVKTVYAADWSEYHSINGWFNMDPLWMSSNLDVIGIDYYMPVTEVLPQSEIDKTIIVQGFEKGEGWEYFYTDSFNKTGKTNYSPADGTSPFAWKNIENFWKASSHVNPNATNVWSAKPKPIWMTEYGYPSVDACTNMPNVFYDPRSSESFFPIGSNGSIDLTAQRTAVDAFVDYWNSVTAESGNANLVPRKFLWTWDARPYPFWPYLQDVWADGLLWEPGHWVQGKFGVSTLGTVVADILGRVGYTPSDYDVSDLSDLVFGYSVSNNSTARQLIETLQNVYHFDAVDSGGVLKFKSRRNKKSQLTIPVSELLTSNADYPLTVTRQQQIELPTFVEFSFVDLDRSYQTGTQVVQRQTVSSYNKLNYEVEIVLGSFFAKKVAETNLYNPWIERTSFQFTLPTKYCRVEPTDIIIINDTTLHTMRVVSTVLERDGSVQVTAVAHDLSVYNFNQLVQDSVVNTLTKKEIISDTFLEFLDLPAFPTDTGQQGYLRFGAIGDGGDTWRGSLLYRSDDGGENNGNTFDLLTPIESKATVGTVLNLVGSGPRNATDYGTTIDVVLKNGTLESVSEIALLNGANIALVGEEILQFQTATLTAANRYTLSTLLRGRLGTEDKIESHSIADRFVLINSALVKTDTPLDLINLLRYYKSVSIGNTLANTQEYSFTYTGNSLKPYSVVNVSAKYISTDIVIEWTRRTRLNGQWRDFTDVPLTEETEKYEIDIIHPISGLVLRTLYSTTNTVTYFNVDQITDFTLGGLPLTSLRVIVYQMSAVVGRGNKNDSILVL